MESSHIKNLNILLYFLFQIWSWHCSVLSMKHTIPNLWTLRRSLEVWSIGYYISITTAAMPHWWLVDLAGKTKFETHCLNLFSYSMTSFSILLKGVKLSECSTTYWTTLFGFKCRVRRREPQDIKLTPSNILVQNLLLAILD